jgi:C-terminal processing protease CtpA/Prc
MGEASQGAFSDILDKRMPRGIGFGFSNEIYRSADGEWFEGKGVPVDVAMATFDRAERLAGKDLILEAAIARLLAD